MNLPNWDFSALLHVDWKDGALHVLVGPVAQLVAVGVLLVLLVIALKRAPKQFRVDSVKFTFLGTEVAVKRTSVTAQLAHEAYVEMVTRKVALAFDEEHDVIAEVYESWYAAFGEIRLLTRQLEASSIAYNKDLQKLNDLLIAVLNEGMRPHLTRWQGRYRRWYDHEVAEKPNDAPQEIQKQYPQYDELIVSLHETNGHLENFSKDLRKLAYGR